MTIKIDNYLLEADKEGGFNISFLSTTKKGTKIGTETKTILAYNISFENCLKRIIHNSIYTSNEKLSLKEFLAAYKKEVDRIHELAKGVYR